jgi:arylsulfatase A-like enzyme
MRIPAVCRWIILYAGFSLPCFAQAQTGQEQAARGMGGQSSAGARRPNILVIFSDDHAYQAISAYGSKLMETPNIDRIAREGALFKNVFVSNSLCSPSRATLLTGKYSHINGREVNYGTPFNVHQELFTRILKENNYQTAWIGKWHLQALPDGMDDWKILVDQGHYYNPDFISPAIPGRGAAGDTTRITGYVTDIISNLTFDWLDHRDTAKPFCLIVGEKAPHREWLPDLQDLGSMDSITFPASPTFHDDYEGRDAARNQDMTIAKTMLLQQDLKVHLDQTQYNEYTRLDSVQRKVFFGYYDKITSDFEQHGYTGDALLRWKYERYLKDYLATTRSLDRNIGKILDYLDRTGLSKNTVVIYASDQGFYLGEHGWFDKRWMYEESLRTPFVMRYPGTIRPGTTISQMVVNIDFAPTLLNIAGIKPPADMQGQSFLPLLKTGAGDVAWRKAMYYHYYEFPQPHHVSPHFGIRTERYKLIRFYGPADSWELFDLQKDPHEIRNLYGLKEYAGITLRLRKQLDGLISQYKDTDAAEILKKDLGTNN